MLFFASRQFSSRMFVVNEDDHFDMSRRQQRPRRRRTTSTRTRNEDLTARGTRRRGREARGGGERGRGETRTTGTGAGSYQQQQRLTGDRAQTTTANTEHGGTSDARVFSDEPEAERDNPTGRRSLLTDDGQAFRLRCSQETPVH